MLFIVSVGLLNYAIGKYSTILFMALGIVGLKYVDINRTIKLALITKIFAFILMLLACFLGIIENTVFEFERNGEIINRYALGYSHPNTLQQNVTIIIILFLYLCNNRLHMWHYAVLFLGEYWFYKITFSRTGFLIGCICILLSISTRNKVIRKYMMKCTKRVYELCMIITLLEGFLYGKVGILYLIDEMLTGRIRCIHNLLASGLPHWIGNTSYNSFVNFDNGYMTLLYQGGILAFGWVMYYMMRAYKMAYEKDDYLRYVLMLEFAIYALTEGFFPNIALNISLLFIGEILFEKDKKRKYCIKI